MIDKNYLASIKEWHELAKGSKLNSGLIFADPSKIDELIEMVEHLQKEIEQLKEEKRRNEFLENL